MRQVHSASQTCNSRYGIDSCPGLQGTGLSKQEGWCQPMPSPPLHTSLPTSSPPSPWGKLKHARILLVLISQFHQILLFSSKQLYNIQLYPSKFQIIFSSLQPLLINYCRKISFGVHVTKCRLSHTTSLTLLSITCWESRLVTLEVLL